MLSASHRAEERWRPGVAVAVADGTDAACVVVIGSDECRGALGGGRLLGVVEQMDDLDGPCEDLPTLWYAYCDCNKR